MIRASVEAAVITCAPSVSATCVKHIFRGTSTKGLSRYSLYRKCKVSPLDWMVVGENANNNENTTLKKIQVMHKLMYVGSP